MSQKTGRKNRSNISCQNSTLQSIFVRLVDSQKTVTIDLQIVQSLEGLCTHKLRHLLKEQGCVLPPSTKMSIWLKGRILRIGTPLSVIVSPGDTIWIGTAVLQGGSHRSSSSDYDSNYKRVPNDQMNLGNLLTDIVANTKEQVQIFSKDQVKKKLKKLKEKCIKKCQDVQLFEVAFEKDLEEIYEKFDDLSMSQLHKIEKEELKTLYKDKNKEQKMKFINDLPKEQKYSMIQAINYKPTEYVNKKEEEKIASFLINWFDVCLNDTQSQNDSILYPQEDVSEVRMLIQKNLELRTLSMSEPEDLWFTQAIKTLPKKIYDQMMLAKFLPKSALLELGQIPIITSFMMQRIKTEIIGSTYEFLQFVHFNELEEDDESFIKEKYERMLNLFSCSSDMMFKQTEDNVANFKKLQQFPGTQKVIADQLVVPDFLQKTFPQFSEKIKHHNQLQNMIKMIGTFDKKTQTLFYKNLCDAMAKYDNMQSKFDFHPEILAMKDKSSIKEVLIDKKAIQEGKRFWLIDYPVLGYVEQDKCRLTMAHLADPQSKKKTFPLDEGDTFVAFVDRFPDSKDAQVSFLVFSSEKNLNLKTYTYRNPFEKKDFTDSANNWVINSEQFTVSKEIKNVLQQDQKIIKVSLIEKEDEENESDEQIYKGLLIQTDEFIFYQNLDDPSIWENLISEDLTVKLEMIRGLSDKFYYALRDDGAASDSLAVLKFKIEEKKLVYENESIPAAYTGEILAFELDPLNNNDVESYYHDNKLLDEWQDKLDRIYIIDGRLNLFKLELQREPRTLTQTSLTKLMNVQTMVETKIRGKNFIRIGVNDRCLMINGRTINYRTGHEWDFIFNDSCTTISNTLKIIQSETLPYSQLQMALVTSEEKAAFLINNETSSRRKCLFDHRSRDVLLFQVLSDNLILAKLRGTPTNKQKDCKDNLGLIDTTDSGKIGQKSDDYWTLMTFDGNMKDMPEGMKELLDRKDWVTVQSKQVETKEEEYIGHARIARETKGILIVLSHYKKLPDTISSLYRTMTAIDPEVKKSQKFDIPPNHNPFPDIGSVLIDIEANKKQVICKQYNSRNKLVKKKDEEGKETTIFQDEEKATFEALLKFKMRFKIVLNESGKIFLFYSDPLRTTKPTSADIQKYNTEDETRLNMIKLRVGVLTRTYWQFFKDDSLAPIIGKTMLLKDREKNEIITIRYEPYENNPHDLNKQKKLFSVNKEQFFLPSGDCILSDCSPFYRSDLSEMYLSPELCQEDDQDKCTDHHQLKFPKTLQVSYPSKTIVSKLLEIKLIKDEKKGRHQTFEGLNLIFDPEKYVDTGITLRKMKEEICKDENGQEEKLKIWTQYNADFSKDNYYIYQDWWWLQTEQKTPRKYSFMGFYQKYCAADLQEIMRLQKQIREKKAIRTVEEISMFASFKGISIFQIFFRQVKILLRIVNWLEHSEFVNEHDKDDNEIENQSLRRIYYTLACHSITDIEFKNLGNSSSVIKSNINIGEKSCFENCVDWSQKTIDSLLRKSEDDKNEIIETENKKSTDTQHVSCNSLLYRILRTNNAKSRDLILQIASYCEQYSLQNFFISQDDVKSVLQQPSLQVQKAFDDILIETSSTKQVLTLDISFEDARVITLWHSNMKMSVEECQEMTITELKNVEEEDIMMNSVSVKLMKIKWLREGNRNFLDLVNILNDTKNVQIIATKFVSSLLSGYWDIYYEKIFWTQFMPFVFYMIGMISFLVYALQEKIEESETFDRIYYPLYGYCTVFIVNQARCEYIQWKMSEQNKDYFLDYWNMNDLTYLLMNIIVMIANLFGHYREWQITLSAVSVCFLWFKVFDWLRLFDTTAFFIRLIQETILSIRSFLIILFLCYMMFGSAFYIININLEEDSGVVPVLSGIWFLDAFQNQYELSLGEYEIDAYRGAEIRKFLIYVLFLLSTFIIQITFLNMLIAIMGDTFDRATEERDNNARLTKLKIMGDYIDLILQDEDQNEVKDQLKNQKEIENMNKSYVPKEQSAMSIIDSSVELKSTGIDEDKAKKAPSRGDLLYVVQPSEEDGDENQSWEGHLSTLKRATEKSISKTESTLSKSLDKVLERVIEAESRDATQEREMKQNLDKVMKNVKEQIESVIVNQTGAQKQIESVIVNQTGAQKQIESVVENQKEQFSMLQTQQNEQFTQVLDMLRNMQQQQPIAIITQEQDPSPQNINQDEEEKGGDDGQE